MNASSPVALPAGSSPRGLAHWIEARLHEVNRELWLVLSMLILAGFLNFLAGAERMVLGFYTLPTLFSAYMFGRRHAVLTAFASAFLVGLLSYFEPALFMRPFVKLPIDDKWFDLTIWAGILVLTAYAMGTLYDSRARSMQEVREAYRGVLLVLHSMISRDRDVENHSYRVSVYAARIARLLHVEDDRIEDLRSAALLHELLKVDVGHEVLQKAAQHSRESAAPSSGAGVGGSLPRVLPILLGIGTSPEHQQVIARGEDVPLESRILAVADVFDSLTSDRPYRKAMSPFDAKEVILRGAGSDFDPAVVKAFVSAFDRRQLEVPAFGPSAA